MTTTPALRRVAALAAAMGLAASASACSADTDWVPEPPPGLACAPASDELAVVWGARANNPAPGLPEPVDRIFYSSFYEGAQIRAIVPDGDPSQDGAFHVELTAGNDDAKQREFDEAVAGALDGFAALRSEEPGADVLESLRLAADSMGEAGTVLVVDSGLQTTAPLDFPGDGLLSAEPAEVAAYLADTDYLPDLAGQTVVWVGLGDTVEPQPDLETPHRNDLERIWTAVLESAGACVEFIDQPLTGEPLYEDFAEVPATELPVNPPPPDSCGTVVYDSSTSLRFKLDEAVFTDAAGAEGVLADIAASVIEDGMRVKVTGTTSSEGTAERNLELSQERAEAVEAVLAANGVPEEWIETDGVGSEFEGWIPDIGAGGELLPGPASRNRAVIIELTCTG